MENNLAVIGDKKLHEIVIPGTHDGGCYHKYGLVTRGSYLDFGSKNIICSLEVIFHIFLVEKSETFRYAQDESIYDQLVYGIRYLDIRIGYYEDMSEPLQIVHNKWECFHSLRDVLLQVRNFLMSAPKEIVIFDFHGFGEGFDIESKLEERHKQVINLCKSILNDFIIPFIYSKLTIIYQKI